VCILDACNLAMVRVPSELESGLARRFRQRLDPPVILVARAVERDRLDAELLRPLGDAPSHRRRRADVDTALAAADALLEGRRRGQDLRTARVDQLGIDVAVRAVHGEARRALLRDPGARAAGPAQTLFPLFEHRLVLELAPTSSSFPSTRSAR